MVALGFLTQPATVTLEKGGLRALPMGKYSFKIMAMSIAVPQSNTTDLATPLARALEQNETIQEIVDQSATELAVIHAVLKQEIPGHVQTGEVAHALQRTDAIETIINGAAHELAHELAQVNEVLAQEIDERIDLECELLATKAALLREKAKP